MISYVKGVLEYVASDRVIVSNQGIGFEIYVPMSVLNKLPQVGNEVKMFTYMNVKEDDISLFGFVSRDELDMFKLLITVNGIGPKGALSILSTMDVDNLRMAILSGDAKSIAKSPGVGQKTASRLIIDLKDKCDITDIFDGEMAGAVESQSVNADVRNDAIEALVALGYSVTEATAAVRKVNITEDSTSDEVLKESLKHIF